MSDYPDPAWVAAVRKETESLSWIAEGVEGRCFHSRNGKTAESASGTCQQRLKSGELGDRELLSPGVGGGDSEK